MANACAKIGEICSAKIKAGISAVAVISICSISATQHIAAVPNMNIIDNNVPKLTSLNLFFAPISAKNAANHRTTKPPYDAPERNGFPFPTCSMPCE